MNREFIVEKLNPFGSVILNVSNDEFMEMGYEFGDLLNIEFENGCVLKDVPYYSGFYVRRGAPVVVSYSQDPFPTICYNYYSFADAEGIVPGMRVWISVSQKGVNKTINEKRNLYYTNDRSEYDSDEKFANSREVYGGRIKRGILFRACSPFDDHIKRRSYVASFCEKKEINALLNLADTREKLLGYLIDDELPDFSRRMINENRVVCCPLKIDYCSKEYRDSLRDGISSLALMKGPFLIHCLEGKDRSGFVCALLGALGGMNFREIIDDYMITYDNYYHVNKLSDSMNYNMIAEENIMDMLMSIRGYDFAYSNEYYEELLETDWHISAVRYLSEIGVKLEAISSLYKELTDLDIIL